MTNVNLNPGAPVCERSFFRRFGIPIAVGVMVAGGVVADVLNNRNSKPVENNLSPEQEAISSLLPHSGGDAFFCDWVAQSYYSQDDELDKLSMDKLDEEAKSVYKNLETKAADFNSKPNKTLNDTLRFSQEIQPSNDTINAINFLKTKKQELEARRNELAKLQAQHDSLVNQVKVQNVEKTLAKFEESKQ